MQDSIAPGAPGPNSNGITPATVPGFTPASSVADGNNGHPPASSPATPPTQHVGSLLAGLASKTSEPFQGAPSPETKFENQLAVVRLGMATSLFYALRAKHAPTAAHSLRVALACSAWAEALGLAEADRDRLEVAALLHDVGKISVPDRILRKAGKLTAEEQATVDACPTIACEILRGCTADQHLLEIVQFAKTWFESRRQDDSARGQGLPLGARMLSIVVAFDAMTTDQVYRKAISRDRALEEICRAAGSQFDPDLAVDFARMLDKHPELLSGTVVDRWLKQLQSTESDKLWQQCLVEATVTAAHSPSGSAASSNSEFLRQLAADLHEGVAFTDNEGTITHWNHAMERMTGVAAEAIVGQQWNEQTLGLQAADDQEEDVDGIVTRCLARHSCDLYKLQIRRDTFDIVPIQLQISPVSKAAASSTFGTVIIARDMSDQAHMEQRLAQMRRKATLDPLTKVANRAEFDSRLAELTEQTEGGGPTFSLMICDIDFFKRVNDVHGHPAGDAALVSFAGILKAQSREGDLVARYGGEEFIVLTPKCVNSTATKRAEGVRKKLESTPLPSLGGAPVTASFGVTEYQTGDSAESILARADRALLKAKENGRNRVIQLGSGRDSSDSDANTDRKSWLGWFNQKPKDQVTELSIHTSVPLTLAIEKLRGYIADHDVKVLGVRENELSLEVARSGGGSGRRAADSQLTFSVNLTLSESTPGEGGSPGGPVRTLVRARLKPVRSRDRRQNLELACDQVVAGLNSYLMGKIVR